MPHFHLTSRGVLDQILAEGLKPLIGARSRLANEGAPAIYLFETAEAAENAILNWYDLQPDEGEDIALLEVDTEGLNLTGNDTYEVLSLEPIAAHRIRVVMENIDDVSAWETWRKNDAHRMS